MAAKSELLTDHEAAALLRCSRFALVRFRQERRGPAFVRVGKLIRYRQSDLLDYLAERTVRPEASQRVGESATAQ